MNNASENRLCLKIGFPPKKKNCWVFFHVQTHLPCSKSRFHDWNGQPVACSAQDHTKRPHVGCRAVCLAASDTPRDEYPLVNLQKTMENHHAINGKIHYFDWVIFNSYFDITRGYQPVIWWCEAMPQIDLRWFKNYWPLFRRGSLPQGSWCSIFWAVVSITKMSSKTWQISTLPPKKTWGKWACLQTWKPQIPRAFSNFFRCIRRPHFAARSPVPSILWPPCLACHRWLLWWFMWEYAN